MKSIKSLWTILFAFMLNTSCFNSTYDEKLEQLYSHSVPLIRPAEVKENLKNENLIILDIRSEEEFQVSHLPSARLISYNDFSPVDLQSIPKDAEVIVYCSVGYRSEKIGEKMIQQGFTQVKNLYGGIFQWKNEGLEVVNRNNLATDSVHTYNEKWSKWLTNGIKVYD